MSPEVNRAELLSELDTLERRILKVRQMATPPATRDVSPECQAKYDIAVAASAATAAAYAAHEALVLIDQAAWFEYWDCESP